MIDVNTINAWLGIQLPPWLVAMVMAVLISWGGTQPLKFLLPLAIPAAARHWATRLIAFTIAAYIVVLLKPAGPELTFVLAMFAGLFSPLIAAIFMAWLKKRYPWVADVITQDVRGVLFGEPRGDRENGP